MTRDKHVGRDIAAIMVVITELRWQLKLKAPTRRLILGQSMVEASNGTRMRYWFVSCQEDTSRIVRIFTL